MEAWEGLEFDDSDMESVFKKCNANVDLIPGPAGNVQAVLLNRERDEPQNTQQFVNQIAQATYERDFKSTTWKWAQMFIKCHGLDDEGDMKYVTKLYSERNLKAYRLPFVACIVKECKFNGLGDMTVTIKDESGTTKASVHRKVVEDGRFGPNIAIGSVMLLQDVGVFHPPGPNHYLNITIRNVVKVFKFDICPPTEELVKASVAVVRTRAGEEVNVDDILKKLKRPSNEVPCSGIGETSNGPEQNSIEP